MASIASVVEGLEILAKTATIPADLLARCETNRRLARCELNHDIICGPELDAEPSEDDRKRLEEIGWCFDDNYGRWYRGT